MPITALAFLQLDRLYLLVGEGQHLKIFDHETKCLLHMAKAFDVQAIHGICCRAVEGGIALLLIWGGRSTCTIRISVDPNDSSVVWTTKRVPELQAKDWILDGCHRGGNLPKALSSESCFHSILVTAQNELLSLSYKCDPNGVSHAEHSLTSIASGPRSILYSAHVLRLSDDLIQVAAGTVFGEVLLWSYSNSTSKTSAKVCLHHTSTGHEGSVFGVKIAEEVDEGNGKRLLASCSDDRTIRIWDISEKKKTLQNDGPGQMIDGDHDAYRLHNSKSNVECLAMVMGHASRIWGIRFLSQTDGHWNLLSYGEDSTVQLWKLSPICEVNKSATIDQDLTYALSNETSHAFHSGKNVWAVSLHSAASSGHFVASGGADGRIAEYQAGLGENHQEKDMISVSVSIHETSVGTACLARKLSPTQQQQIITKTIFDSLRGDWKLFRTILSKDQSYPSGELVGNATFVQRLPSDDAFDGEYLYSENGEFITNRGLRMQASRQYVYRYNHHEDAITAWFVKVNDGSTVDYYFHTLNLLDKNFAARKLVANGYHLCIDDHYKCEYGFQVEGSQIEQWSIKYVVQGPKKDYITEAVYTRGDAIDSLHSMASVREETNIETSAEAFEGVDQISSPKLAPDSFKTYVWISKDKFLVSTNQGNILLGSINSRRKSEDEPLITLEHKGHQVLLSSSCVAVSLPSLGVAFLSGTDGMVFIYDHDSESIQVVHHLARKASFLRTQRLSALWNQALSVRLDILLVGIIATCLGSCKATILILHQEEDSKLRLKHDYSINLPMAFIVTSSCFHHRKQLIILGSRSGDVAMYDFHQDFLSSNEEVKPYSYSRIHHKETVTVIESIPTDLCTVESTYILTAGRDGSYCIHQITYPESDGTDLALDFQTLHRGTLPFGPNIEGLCITTGQLYLWGFRSKEFVVWNESLKTELLTVKCGGAHRNWAYHNDLDGKGGGNFVYTKASVCYVHAQAKASHQLFQKGGHGREIKTMALSQAISDETGPKFRLLATGAEDTNIRISKVACAIADINCESIIAKHTTGLQKLEWSTDGNYLFSAAGCEEFFVWKIHRVPLITLGVICEAKCPVVTEEADLRIMDFAVLSIQSSCVGTLACDEDTADYLLSMAYSDSSVRVFRYQTHSKAFMLLCHGVYGTHCLTQVVYLRFENDLCLCTASTDGYLALWPLPFKWLERGNGARHQDLVKDDRSIPLPESKSIGYGKRIRVHQSSIKSLVTIPLLEQSIMVLTGGDDGAIGFTLLSSSFETSEHHTLLVPKAHASAVTAVAYLGPLTNDPRSNATRHRVASVGNDQRLKMWRVSFDAGSDSIEGVEVKKEGNVYTAVADASSLEVEIDDKGKGRVVVAGIGVEWWKFGDEGGFIGGFL